MRRDRIPGTGAERPPTETVASVGIHAGGCSSGGRPPLVARHPRARPEATLASVSRRTSVPAVAVERSVRALGSPARQPVATRRWSAQSLAPCSQPSATSSSSSRARTASGAVLAAAECLAAELSLVQRSRSS